MENKTPNNRLNREEMELLLSNPETRRKAAYESHLIFFSLYFHEHIKFEMAPFHKDFINLSESEEEKTLVIEAFRGSAKSTILSQSYPLWAIMGKPQKKFIVIFGQTQLQAKQQLANIKRELERNELLRADMGPFHEEEDEWKATALVIPKYDAKIMAVSIETSVRGLKYGSNRPSVIIIDDIEDMASVKNKEGRDKVYNWFFGDVMPMKEDETKVIVVGTRLHDDGFLMRLKKLINTKMFNATFRSYPILDAEGTIAWLGRYKTMDDIEKLKRNYDQESWSREFLLKIIDDERAVIRREWISYYETLPPQESYCNYRYTATGIDLAIREEARHDFTAMVSGSVYGSGDDFKIYIHANPINKKMDFPTTVETAKRLSTTLGNGQQTKLYIESVGYQVSIVQELLRQNYPAEEFKVHGEDKQMRLSLTSHLLQNGTIKFSPTGNEDLIQQLINFGSEKRDDLADAFSILILKIIETEKASYRLLFPIDEKQSNPQAQKDAEHEADTEIMLRDAANKGDPIAAAKYRVFMQKKNKKYWDDEERDGYNRIMGRW
jgi:hypothetical protein